MKRIAQLFVTLGMAGILGLGAPLPATAAKYEMKLGHAMPATEYSHFHGSMLVLKSEVERRTNGNLTVTIYPNNTLGQLKAMIEQTIRGMIQCVPTTEGSMAAFFPDIAVVSIPYLFREPDIAYRVMDGKLGEELAERMVKQTGLRPIAWGEDAGFRHFTSSKKMIKSPADMKGMKIRCMQVPAHLAMVTALGASPTAVSWGELYTALQTSVAEGQENPITNIRVARLNEVQKYLTLDGHLYSIMGFFVNETWFQSLPEDYRASLVQSAKIAGQVSRSLGRINEVVDLEYLKQNGMEVYAPTAEEKEAFKNATREPLIKLLKESLDPELVDLALEETARAEKELGYN